MFDGFLHDHVNRGEVTLRIRYGGSGAPVVLLHGDPRTLTTWHTVAPRLAEHRLVVTPDLRGYGAASGSTVTMTKPTGRSDGRSHARCSCAIRS
jgi:haloacetate dehalogenase